MKYFTTSWHDEILKFRSNLDLLKADIQPDPVHDLRVAIKKLRAYADLAGKKKESKEAAAAWISVEELFALLGKQRDMDKGLELLPHYVDEKTTAFISAKTYFELMQMMTSGFCKTGLHHFKPENLDIITNDLQSHTEGLDEDDLGKHLVKKAKKSLDALDRKAASFKKNFHEIRKGLKTVYYWLKIAPEEILLSKKQMNNLDGSLDLLGDIQDIHMLERNLEHFRKQLLPSEKNDHDIILEAEKKLEKKREGMMEKAEEKTDIFHF
jgi:CHAD domain-containing protein